MIPNDMNVRFTHHLEILEDGDDFVLPAGGRISTVEADPNRDRLHVWWIEETIVDEDGEPLTRDELPESWTDAYEEQAEELSDEFHSALDGAWGGGD